MTKPVPKVLLVHTADTLLGGTVHRVPVSELQKSDASLGPDDTVLEAARILERTSGSPILIRQAGTPVGVLTEEDIIAKVLAQGDDPRRVSVRDVMEAGRLSREGDALLVEDDGAAINPLRDAEPLNRLSHELEDLPVSRQLSIPGQCEECETEQQYLFDFEGLVLCEDCLGSREAAPGEEPEVV